MHLRYHRAHTFDTSAIGISYIRRLLKLNQRNHFEIMDYPNLENLASAMEIEDDIMKDIFMQQTLA